MKNILEGCAFLVAIPFSAACLPGGILSLFWGMSGFYTGAAIGGVIGIFVDYIIYKSIVH